ncbi:hypothetical protein ACIGEL_12095 [Rossellomorea aquimaris]|uniref:hypothetical protein n=1 Tax=Rossellomorea aquimaris TaxID=189382 RepID=UPI0037C5E65A
MKKSGRALPRGDKHKARWQEGAPFHLHGSLTYDLEPLSPGAGHEEKRSRVGQARQA